MELCPLAPLPKSLTMFFLIILCEFSIFDNKKKEWNCVFKAYQIQNFLIGKGALPLCNPRQSLVFNHVFLSDKFVWILSIFFTKKEWNYVS